MGSLSNEMFEILKFLLPGFVTVFIFRSLSSQIKQNEFSTIVSALIFTTINRPILNSVESLFLNIGKKVRIGDWNTGVETLWSFIIALLIALILSAILNNDLFHKVLRKIKVTRETSYPSEWYGTFSEHEFYVTLYLDGERRIMGWPHTWPSNPKRGHFVLIDAEWLLDNGDSIKLNSKDRIIISASEVQMVQQMDFIREKENGNESTGSEPDNKGSDDKETNSSTGSSNEMGT